MHTPQLRSYTDLGQLSDVTLWQFDNCHSKFGATFLVVLSWQFDSGQLFKNVFGPYMFVFI